MAWLAPSLDALRGQIYRHFSALPNGSIGWIGDPAHAARKSEHNPDPDGSVDAIDVPHRPEIGLDCHRLVSQLVESGDSRLQRIIWNRRIWDPQRGWRAYTGSSPHTAHAHIETTNAGQMNAADWRLPMFGLRPAQSVAITSEEDDMPTQLFKTADGQHWRVNGPIRVPISPESCWKLAVLGKLELQTLDPDGTAFLFDTTRPA